MEVVFGSEMQLDCDGILMAQTNIEGDWEILGE